MPCCIQQYNRMNQEYELTAEQQQKQFSHSVKLEETAKGVRVSTHVYADTAEHARQEALKVYLGIVHDLQSHDVRLAPMNAAATTATNGIKE